MMFKNKYELVMALYTNAFVYIYIYIKYVVNKLLLLRSYLMLNNPKSG